MTLRRTPADFDVRERPNSTFLESMRDDYSRAFRNAVFKLEKTSLTTPEAIGLFARELRIRPGEVDYAGLKDKHAVTTQMISFPVMSPRLGAVIPRALAGEGWTAAFKGWSAKPATAEAIDGNSFLLVVRDLTAEASAEMARRAALLREGDGLRLINYFGDQRFGSARHGKGFAAEPLIRADFEGALKLMIATPARKDAGKTRGFTRLAAQKWGQWQQLATELPRTPERQAIEVLARGGDFKAAFASLPYFLQSMVVEAYQSHLWNETALALVKLRAGTGCEVMCTEGLFGQNAFLAARDIPGEWRTLEMPVLARGSELVAPWGEAAAQVLASEGLGVQDLLVPGLRRPFFGEASRRLVVAVEAFAMSDEEADELSGARERLRRTVRFSLTRGAYATVVMRALGQ